MIKLIAFDWNGTLLADLRPTVTAENRCFQKLKFNRRLSIKQYQEFYEIPIRNYWLKLGFDASYFDKHTKQVHQAFMDFYEPLEKTCRTRGGAKDVLKWLKKRRISAIIFSNHMKNHIVRQTRRLGLWPYLDEILGRPDHDHSHMHVQNKALQLKTYLRNKGIKPREVMVVGDTDEEIIIGHKYGYHATALTGGHQSQKRLKVARPEFLIHNLKNLKPIIAKLNADSAKN